MLEIFHISSETLSRSVGVATYVFVIIYSSLSYAFSRARERFGIIFNGKTNNMQLLVLVLLVFACSVRGDVFVSSTSNTTTNCGSFDQPCATISAGLSTACTQNSNTSVTVQVMPGMYYLDRHSITCNIQLL